VQLLLIRHGESVGNVAQRFEGMQDGPLTEMGQEQARALARRLKGSYGVCAIHASPLLRARKTAEIVAEALSVPLEFDDRLREYDCGLITGMTIAEVAQAYPEVIKGFEESIWHVPIPGEEGMGSFEQRVVSALDDIVSRHAGGDTVAVVAHYMALTTYLGSLLGLDVRKRSPFVLGNTSLSIVEPGGLCPRLVMVNDTCHLDHAQRGLGQGLERSERQ